MGNYFPSVGHAEQYITDYIKQPLRSLISPTNPPPPPPPPPPPADPHTEITQRRSRENKEAAAAAANKVNKAAGEIELEEENYAATQRQYTVAYTDTRSLRHATTTEANRLHNQPPTLNPQQRSTLATLQTDAATHLGTLGLIDDVESGGDRGQYDRHVHLDTAPPDPRFPGHPDQSRYCWALYGSYLKCIDKRGVLDEHCLFLKKSAVAICPVDLIESWTDDRKAGRWYGVPVPYHKGEMDLLELQDELEAAEDDNEAQKEQTEQVAAEDREPFAQLEAAAHTQKQERPANKQADAGEASTSGKERPAWALNQQADDAEADEGGQTEEVMHMTAAAAAGVAAGAQALPPRKNGDDKKRRQQISDSFQPQWESKQPQPEAAIQHEEQKKQVVKDMKVIIQHAMKAIHR